MRRMVNSLHQFGILYRQARLKHDMATSARRHALISVSFRSVLHMSSSPPCTPSETSRAAENGTLKIHSGLHCAAAVKTQCALQSVAEFIHTRGNTSKTAAGVAQPNGFQEDKIVLAYTSSTLAGIAVRPQHRCLTVPSHSAGNRTCLRSGHHRRRPPCSRLRSAGLASLGYPIVKTMAPACRSPAQLASACLHLLLKTAADMIH